MSDSLPDDVLEYLASEKLRSGADAHVRERVLARLNHSLAGSAAAASTANVTPTSAGLSKTLLATIAFAAGIGTGVTGVLLVQRPAPVAPGPTLPAEVGKPKVVVPEVVEVEQKPTNLETAPNQEVAPNVPRKSVAAQSPKKNQLPREIEPSAPIEAATPPTAAASDSLSEERALIDMARTALTRGKHADALMALKQHQTQFLWGQLAEEREVIWIRTLASSGRRDEAQQRAAAFRSLYTASPLLPLVEKELQAR